MYDTKEVMVLKNNEINKIFITKRETLKKT